MSGLSIGLEALTTSKPKVMVNLNSVYTDTMESYVDVLESITYGNKLLSALDNVTTTSKAVKKFGFTKSMEALIGHQLGSTTQQVSMEAAEAKKGIIKKLVDWLKKLWQKVKGFFAKAFNTRNGIILKLKQLESKKLTVKNDNGFEGCSIDTLREINGYFDDPVKLAEKMDTVADFEFTTIKLKDIDRVIKRYLQALQRALVNIDKAEKNIIKGLKSGETAVAMAQKNIVADLSKSMDGDNTDEMVEETKKRLKAVRDSAQYTSKAVASVFKSAKSFLSYISVDKKK